MKWFCWECAWPWHAFSKLTICCLQGKGQYPHARMSHEPPHGMCMGMRTVPEALGALLLG